MDRNGISAKTDELLKYDVRLNDRVENILSSDFWVLDHVGKHMLPDRHDTPLKFSASVNVYVRRGTCIVDLDLMTYVITAPSLVNIHKSQILQIREISNDFDASCMVMSKRFTDNLFMRMKDFHIYAFSTQQFAVKIPDHLVQSFNRHIELMLDISNDTANPYAYQAQVLAISSFFYHTGHKCYSPLAEKLPKGNNRIPDRFISLVQHNYKEQRFLDFYAQQMGITTKHLSRTMKTLTGFTAVEWIERYVIMEAKVLLKSTNLSVQQISDKLNFPSQSFFGKYFKKVVGMSPKEFRNT